MSNQFGGYWTEQKMQIVVSYAEAYLTIMQAQSWAKTIYFDGFAGSGVIVDDPDTSGEDAKKGTALRILDIAAPKIFDMYYFVEKSEVYKKQLETQIKTKYPTRQTHVVRDDCNVRLKSLANFLSKNKEYRALAFIDPYGMAVEWSSIEALKGLGVDLWILVPTGLAANRMLVNRGDIPEGWLIRLETFFGLDRSEIISKFYRKVSNTLFGEDLSFIEKEKDSVNKLGKLYSSRLKTVFKFVSDSFVMRNSTRSIMFHFMMATNNAAALNIANDVVKPKYKL